MEGARPRRSDVGDWARRAQSIGEWPGVSLTCFEGLVGIEEWVGGGARVDVPGARRGTGRERFGEGTGEGRGEELLLAAGARVGMRRACAAGIGGGAIAEGGGLMVEEDAGARGGAGGGGIRSDAVGGVIVAGEGEVPAEGRADWSAGADGSGSDSEKLGTEWAMSRVVALALGVAWPSPSPSACMPPSGSAARRGGVSGVCLGGRSSAFDGSSRVALWWRKLARRFLRGSHAGGRRQKSTTEATISEMPMRAIVFSSSRACKSLLSGVDCCLCSGPRGRIWNSTYCGCASAIRETPLCVSRVPWRRQNGNKTGRYGSGVTVRISTLSFLV